MQLHVKKYILLFFLFIPLNTNTNLPPMPEKEMLEVSFAENIFNHSDFEYPEKMPRFLSSFYNTIKDTLTDVKNTIFSIPSTIKQALYPPHMFSDQKAQVRYTPKDEICYEEHCFRKKRKKIVQKGLEEFLNNSIDKENMPNIAFCFSGGGFRAMMLTLGFLLGAYEIGLLDTAMYMAGLSGSTWAIAPWIASNQTLETYLDQLHTKTIDGFDQINTPEELRCLMGNITDKLLYKQYISAIDIYGGILANTLLKEFGENRLKIGITQTHQTIDSGSYPLPIYTAITPSCEPYEWFEVTPYEVGSSYLRSYVPTWAHGRKFKYGTSTTTSPEQPLGYYLGIFGSAFEVNFEDLLKHTAFNVGNIYDSMPLFLAKSFEKIIDMIIDSPLNDIRLFPSMIRNFTYKLASSPLHYEKHLSLIDAGIDFNLPFPPLLRKDRKVDVIIVYDGSNSQDPTKQLRCVEAYAKRKNIKLPTIDYNEMGTKLMHIFQDQTRTDISTIIYFPFIKNESYSPDFDPRTCLEEEYCGTFNFTYTSKDITMLSGLAAFTLKQHSEDIKNVIQNVIAKKASIA